MARKVSLRDAAARLGVTKQRAHQMYLSGELRATRHANGLLFDEEHLERVIAARNVAAQERSAEREALQLVAEQAQCAVSAALLDVVGRCMALVQLVGDAAGTDDTSVEALRAAERPMLAAADEIDTALGELRGACERREIVQALPTLRRLGVTPDVIQSRAGNLRAALLAAKPSQVS